MSDRLERILICLAGLTISAACLWVIWMLGLKPLIELAGFLK